MLSVFSLIITAIKSRFKLLVGLSFHASLRRRGLESYSADFTIDTQLGSSDVSQASPSVDINRLDDTKIV